MHINLSACVLEKHAHVHYIYLCVVFLQGRSKHFLSDQARKWAWITKHYGMCV